MEDAVTSSCLDIQLRAHFRERPPTADHACMPDKPVTQRQVADRLPLLLGCPEAEAVRLLALHWLYQLVEQRDRWHAASDVAPADGVQVLHKARVALRRLRAVFKAYAPLLEDVSRPRYRRALAKLSRATNAQRDRDVQRAWLEAECESFAPQARTEAAVMLRRLSRRSTHEDIEAAFTRFLDPNVSALRTRLSTYTVSVRVGEEPNPGPPYAHTLSSILSTGCKHVMRELDLPHNTTSRTHPNDMPTPEALHRLRLQFKLHRALLAPVAELHPSLAALYALETRAQDQLGVMRDTHLLAMRAAREKLPNLAAVATASAAAHARAFLDEWTGQQSTIRETFHSATRALDNMSSPTAARSESLPMEIERKFLLHELPPDALAMPPLLIEQGWIPGTKLRERLRRTTYPDGRVRYTRTVKVGPLAERIELEEDTGAAVFETLWPLTVSARIRKHRHVVRDGSFAWEVDVFLDRELVLAEVEMPSRDTHVDIPEWLSPYVVREVTGDPTYANSQMARPDVPEAVGASAES